MSFRETTITIEDVNSIFLLEEGYFLDQKNYQKKTRMHCFLSCLSVF